MKRMFDIAKRAGALALFAALLLPIAAQAQYGSDSYKFLEAVREGNAPEASKFLTVSGTSLVDTKDLSTGDTALHIVVARRDLGWMVLLLQKRAKIDTRDKQGRTPLMVAAELGFTEGAELLLDQRARVDEPNNRGETPLIRAVQRRDVRLVRLLLDRGANPDKADTLAGQSARDYAKNDPRAAAVLRMIEQTPKRAAAAKVGP